MRLVLGQLFDLAEMVAEHSKRHTCCSCCYNTVYNSKPTMIYDLRKEIEALSPDFLRLEFTTESYEETLSILRDAVKDISELKRGKEYTGGHFKRGVE